MSASFEAEKNRKAFTYTAIIVAVFILIAILWTWQILPPPKPVTQDLIEINLGNFDEGFGTVQPLIKGEKSPGDAPAEQPKATPVASNSNPAEDLQPDDSKDEDAAPVVKPEKPTPKTNVIPKEPAKTTVKNTPPTPVVAPMPKPQKPKYTGYGGPPTGKGNGADQDNGYTSQGNKPGGKGDAGDPNGKSDSYGNTPGGKSGGNYPPVKGDRRITKYYSFQGTLPKATIFARISVSPNGVGTFIGFDKGSTKTDRAYADDIRSRLPNIQFDKADKSSTVTVTFYFKEN